MDDDIIKIAAMAVDPDSDVIEDGTFQSFVKPKKQVFTFITMLTGIANEMVASAPSFSMVAVEFFDFIQLNCDAFETMMGTKISHVVLVAHNGQAFDVPFLL